jgi:hypothetical protein
MRDTDGVGRRVLDNVFELQGISDIILTDKLSAMIDCIG